MNRHVLRSVSQQSGMTLLSCSLVLLGVAMLVSASLRSSQDNISLTYSTIDRLLAQQAAETALSDAAATLLMIPQNLTTAQAQGSHHLGDITGQRFAQGGAMQSSAAPEYFLETLPYLSSADPSQPDVSSPHRYRVTAKGIGLSEMTTVVLQAEFETQTCTVEKIDTAKDTQNDLKNDLQNSLQKGTQGGVQSDNKISAQIDTACIPYVRRLAWRMLHISCIHVLSISKTLRYRTDGIADNHCYPVCTRCDGIARFYSSSESPACDRDGGAFSGGDQPCACRSDTPAYAGRSGANERQKLGHWLAGPD